MSQGVWVADVYRRYETRLRKSCEHDAGGINFERSQGIESFPERRMYRDLVSDARVERAAKTTSLTFRAG